MEGTTRKVLLKDALLGRVGLHLVLSYRSSALGKARHGFGAVAAIVLMGISVSACMPTLNRVSTSVPTPSGYDQKSGTAGTIGSDWPKLFRSRELDGLVATAVQDNLDLAGAVARISQAEAQAASAGAALSPTLDGSVTAQRSASPGTVSSDKGPFTTSVSNQFGAGLTASYALDVWARYRSLQSAGSATAEAARYDRDALAVSIAASTANTYFGILAAKDRIALKMDNVALAGHVLEAIRARVSVGTASALDIAEQESILATQKAAIPALEQQVMQGRNQLAILLGRPPEGFSMKANSLKSLTVPSIDAGLPSALLFRRPDIARAEADLRAAEANIEAARAAYLPSFDLTLTGGNESRTLENMLRPDAAFASALAGMAAPIFDGGSLDASLALQSGRRGEIVAAYRKAIISAFGDVENGLIATKQSRLQEELQGDVVAASRRAYAISEERLRAGTIDLVTLLSVQQNLFQAEEILIQSRLNRLQSAISLIEALGGGFEVKTDARLRVRDAQAAQPTPVPTP